MSDLSFTADPSAPPKTPGPMARMVAKFLRDRLAVAALVLLGIIVLLAILAPWIAQSPEEGSALRRLKPVGTEGHILGTDEIGRDMWARLVWGGRVSLFAGLAPVAIAVVIGGALGMVAGYVGGRVNAVIMRTMDVLFAFPSILLAIAICAVIGPGLLSTILAMATVFTPAIVRITETVTTRVRNMDYIEAARATGVGHRHILIAQVLPNILGTVLVYAASLASLSIVLAAGLSFLGLGLPPPTAEWGQMLNALRQAIYVDPLLSIQPGVMIFLTSVCFNLVSDGLRGAMDVRAD